MKIKTLFCLYFLHFAISQSQNINISGVINSYAVVTDVGCQSVTVNSTAGFSVADRVILIQMKGAIMDSSNTTSFGTLINYYGAGNYEMASIASISGNTINFVDSVLRKYNTSGAVQLVRVPVYTNVTVVGTLSCQSWNGSTGGIVALEASNIITLNADVDVSGKGFRGGILTNGSLVNCKGDTGNYSSSSTNSSSARKGEGIVNDDLIRADGKGSNVNGGGAGEDCNGGGAGGGNFGMGGHGGDSKCNVSCPAYFYQNSGGYPGKKLNYSNVYDKIFLGGGGGAGHQNNSGGTPGTNGGGIILIKADSITGNNHYLKSDGINNTIVANIDGQGGGGAGGTILLSIRSNSPLNASVQGGYGGVDNFTGTDCHGKGGGGGGGIVWTSKPVVNMTMYLNGGAPGVFTSSGSLCYGNSNGAVSGQQGGAIIDLNIPESTAPCNTNGIKKVKALQITIFVFPNPFSDSFSLKSRVFLHNATFVMYDALGREVKRMAISGRETTIERGDLNQGIYFYRILLDKEIVSSGKLIAE